MQDALSSAWSRGQDDIISTIATDEHRGLTDQEAKKRLAEYGDNLFEDDKSVPRSVIFLRQFKNPLIILLLLATALTIALQHWIDAGIIAFAIFVNTALGFFQESKAERAIANLRSYIHERARVVRDGKEMEVDSSTIVPGDILHITGGSRVTADARIISALGFSVDESILTGESLSVSKQSDAVSETAALAERKSMVFAGTLAVDGSARAVVTATGENTEIGRLAKLVSETESEKTPLQVAIQKLSWVIIFAISFIVIGIFTLGVLQQQPYLDMLLLSIAIIVGAVPEALPIGLTAVLAIGVERIAKKKGIMRSLTAAETLGSTTLIMTDKTGTLTEARMQLVDISLLDRLTDASFKGDETRKRYSVVQKELLRLAALNCDVVIENETNDPNEWVLSGSALETNIVRALALHDSRHDIATYEAVHQRLPFSSRYKFSVTSIPREFLPGAYDKYHDPHVVVGAPEVLLERAHIDKETYLSAMEAVHKLGGNGRRVVGVALLTPHTDNPTLTPEDVCDVTFLGVISFHDPIREGVPDVLARIESHGVQVVMATGDLPGTALAIAKEIGWDIDEHAVLSGAQLHQMTDEELMDACSRVRVFARITPEDKLRIARAYHERGEIVAMTGDGVNDAPALKAANIGIAVGSGSDVAKSVADLVLLDDNFKTIVATIEEGKHMLANIKKIFVYLMSNSLDEVILIGGSVLAGIAMPLSAVQIIWVNLFTGSIPAISYAFERQPLNHTDSKKFFDRSVIFLTLGIGTLSSILLFGMYYFLLDIGVVTTTAQSVLFACFGSYILVIAFSFRNLSLPIYKYPFLDNTPLLIGVSVGLILLFATLYIPLFQTLFGTTALALPWLLFVCIWVFINVLIVECAKWFVNKLT